MKNESDIMSKEDSEFLRLEEIKKLQEDLLYYEDVYDRAMRSSRLRTADGAQLNIDRTRDKIRALESKS